jgi:hypothetical protein
VAFVWDHCCINSRNFKHISYAFPSYLNPTCKQSCLQCFSTFTMCCITSRNKIKINEWFVSFLCHPHAHCSLYLFSAAHIPLYLYPFLNTVSRQRPFEYLRLTSLGVIGALVKIDDSEVVNFLLQTEIIPLCLRIMETGSELSKTVATFIVQKILLDDLGLTYICSTSERFYAVCSLSPPIRLISLLPPTGQYRLIWYGCQIT